MSVKILNRKYSNQFFEPDSTGLRQRTNWLLGNIGEWFNLELEFQVDIDFVADMGNTVTVDNYENKFKLNNGKKWQDYGFDLGDEVTLTWVYEHDDNNDGIWGYDAHTIQFIITNIYDNVIETDTDIDFTPFSTIPANYGNKKITNVKFVVLKDIQGINFKYNLIDNNNIQSHSLHSIIDGEISKFKLNDLNNIPYNQYQDMIPVGKQSGMAIKSVKLMRNNPSSSQYEADIKTLAYSTMTLKPYTAGAMLTDNGIRKAKSISMPVISAILPEYKMQQSYYIPYETWYSSQHNNQYIDGDERTLFLKDAPSSDLKYFDISAQFKIYEIGGDLPHTSNPNDKVRLVLFQYENGNALNFKRKIILSEWINTESILNQVQYFSQTIGVDIAENDSLSLAFEYELTDGLTHNASDFYVKLETQYAEIKVLNQGGTNKYKILVSFMLNSMFSELKDFETMSIPNFFANVNAITDIFEIEALPTWNNPNTAIKSDFNEIERLGNTGWFNENFNGFRNKFVIDELNYYDEQGNAISSLDYTKPTILRAKISGFDVVNQNIKIGVGFAYIPLSESEYKHKQENFLQNLFINTGKEYQANAIDTAFNLGENVGNTLYQGNGKNNERVDIMAVDNYISKATGQHQIEISIKLIPTQEFKDLFSQKTEDDRNYIIWANVGDDISVINNSNRVSFLLDFNQFDKYVQPVGEYPNMQAEFLEHYKTESDSGVNTYKGFVEDDLVTRIKFDLDKTQKKLKSVSYGYYVKNVNTGLIYKLENFNFDLTNYPIDQTGTQIIDLNESRQFKFQASDLKNFIKLGVDSVQNNIVKYKGYFATKIRWEDWIKRENVPIEFFDQSAKHNGYNNDWLHYLRTSGHKFYFFTELEIEENQGINIYLNEFEIKFNGYDENEKIDVKYDFFRYSDNTNINGDLDPNTNHRIGNLLLDEPTKIEVTLTNLAGDLNANEIYGIVGLEVKDGAGEKEYYEISSVFDNYNNNILLTLPNESRLKIEQLTSNKVKFDR